MARIRAALFDFGGVLAEEGFREGLKAIAKNNNLDPEYFFAAADALIYKSGYLTGKSEESEYWETLRRRTGIREKDRELRNAILKRFIPRPKVIAYTDILRSAGITVALLSDQTNWLEELDREMLLFTHFDRIFNSFTFHKSKRDPSVFQDVCNDLGIKPGETLFIDDNIKHIHRAEKAGLRTIHYTTFDDFEKTIRAFVEPLRQEQEALLNKATSRGLRRKPAAGAGGLQVAGFNHAGYKELNMTRQQSAEKTERAPDLRGKSVAIRHATETDLAFLEENLKRQGFETGDIHLWQFVVAVEDKRIIGFGRLRKTGDAYDIGCIAVAEEHGNPGISEAIADHLIDYAGVKKAYVPRELVDHFRKRGFTVADKQAGELMSVVDSMCRTNTKRDSVLMILGS